MKICSINRQMQLDCCIPAEVLNKQMTCRGLSQPGNISCWGVADIGFYGNWHKTDVSDKW